MLDSSGEHSVKGEILLPVLLDLVLCRPTVFWGVCCAVPSSILQSGLPHVQSVRLPCVCLGMTGASGCED